MIPNPVSRWRQVRAALIAAVLFFNVVAAIPTPGYVSDALMRRQDVREELVRWVAWIQSLGIDATEDEVKTHYQRVANGIEKLKTALTRPFHPVFAATGTHQGWMLFAAPRKRPSALVINVRDDAGPWRTLYKSGTEHGWRGGLLEYRRVRAQYRPRSSTPQSHHDGFVRWITAEIFAEHPQVVEIEVFFERRHVTPPWRPLDPARSNHFNRRVPRPAR